ncbi:MAG: hypothetical protein Q4G69_00870 [Planctomycetia bacterium]|nr:hypothetical protein [Planctomycetia bacterium]
MKKIAIYCLFIFLLGLILVFPRSAGAFNFFQSVRKVEADPNKEYMLQESDGLWFIMIRIPRGEEGKKNASDLVQEFRKKYKLSAYLYKYEPGESDLEELAERNRSIKKYKYQTAQQPEYAVLVGSFPDINDLGLQKTLLTIRRSRPDCLSKDPVCIATTERFAALAKKNKEYAGYGPLGGAIIVPNPLIPKEYYNQKGVVDTFLEKINSDSKYSLLNNSKMYTLRVATFSGDWSVQKSSDKERELGSKLQTAGIKAAALCEALRKKGVEAWEFHDRESSFVTIGSFESYGTNRPDGCIEINPEINKLIEQYRGHLQGSNGAYNAYTVTVDISSSLGKKERMQIPFDLQPVIIAVPQRPENFKKAFQAKRKQEQERQQVKTHKTEENLVGNDTRRNFSKNIKKKETEFVLPEGADLNQTLQQHAVPMVQNQGMVAPENRNPNGVPQISMQGQRNPVNNGYPAINPSGMQPMPVPQGQMNPQAYAPLPPQGYANQGNTMLPQQAPMVQQSYAPAPQQGYMNQRNTMVPPQGYMNAQNGSQYGNAPSAYRNPQTGYSQPSVQAMPVQGVSGQGYPMQGSNPNQEPLRTANRNTAPTY